MSTLATTHTRRQMELEAGDGFSKIVVGLEVDDASSQATRQAALLLKRNGLLSLIAAYQPLALAPVWGAYSIAYREPELRKTLKEDAVNRLWQAEQIVTRREPGELIEAATKEEATAAALVAAAAEIGADLIAIGAPRSGRLWGILSGQTATFVLHRAPCSVLVARAPVIAAFKRITVGIDGSPASAHALEIARAIADRFDAELSVVAAYGGFALDLDAVEALDPDYISSASNPVDALLGYAGASDLLVVGSRGLKGIRSLGSVSERAAHDAACSVLVVR
jgi:nucleotide-binding universal stress UspA family protein